MPIRETLAAAVLLATVLAVAGCSTDTGSSSGMCLNAKPGIGYIATIVVGAHDKTLVNQDAVDDLKSASVDFEAAIAAAKKDDKDLPLLHDAALKSAQIRVKLLGGDDGTLPEVLNLYDQLQPLSDRCK